jgi:antitoxin component YwqK of YwqJK toxin-antitoxin module
VETITTMSCSRVKHFVEATAVAAAMVFAQDAARVLAAPAPASDVIYLDEPAIIPPPVFVTAGKLQDKYEDGAIRLEREVRKMSDDSLVNHGAYIEYYPNGQKFAEGNYDNGVHDGTWTFWHDNGQICKTVTFNKGRADGTWEVFRADGTLQAKKSYKDAKREGQWVTYHDDGKTILTEENYVGGKRNGVSRSFFSNGKPQREIGYKDDQFDGQFVEWDETGRKVGEINFKLGKKHGPLIQYRPDGQTIEKMYNDGKLVTESAG